MAINTLYLQATTPVNYHLPCGGFLVPKNRKHIYFYDHL